MCLWRDVGKLDSCLVGQSSHLVMHPVLSITSRGHTFVRSDNDSGPCLSRDFYVLDVLLWWCLYALVYWYRF